MWRPAIVAVIALFAAVMPAAAADIASNYTFPDGSPGFALNALLPAAPGATLEVNAILNPEVLVGFNPQPDPPGTPPTFLSLVDPTSPVFANLSPGLAYSFVISFINFFPPDPCEMTFPAPDAHGNTGFSCSGLTGGSPETFDVALNFDGPGGVADWVAFNPQPDPPGEPVGEMLSFAGLSITTTEDPTVTLSISLNGTPLDFSAIPEPGTLSLFGTALVGFVSWRRRQRRR
jgi:hypothetical protein